MSLKLSPKELIEFTTKNDSTKIRFDKLLKSRLPNNIFEPKLWDEFIEIFDLEHLVPHIGFDNNIDDIKNIYDIQTIFDELDRVCIKSPQKLISIDSLQFFQIEVNTNGSRSSDKPIKVVACGDLLTGEPRYILIDGYHRIAERLCNNNFSDIPADIYL